MQKSSTFTLLITLLFVIVTMAQPATTGYITKIEQWHNKRITNLKGENGWLTVSGLFWLKEGENSAGSSKNNQVVFPEGKAAEKIGSFTLKNGEVSFTTQPGTKVSLNDSDFTSGVIYSDKIEEQSMVLHHRNLRWFIIKRGSKYGVRLRDLDSEARKNFTHIERFNVDSSYKVMAVYEKPEGAKTIPIHDVIGLTTETEFGGTLIFELHGKKLKLDATLEGDDLFIVFADETSGISTYGGGRFLYAKVPTNGNLVELDFNKAYNPPCAFTDFATCPLPPDQNKLAVEIKAGEKKYGNH